ncbi:MAG: guanylate kinase [Candidatus Saccharimonadales bacterium]
MDELQTQILGYKPGKEAKAVLADTKVLLLVGPTGSGKNTLERELLKTGNFKPIVTHTSRKPRINNGQVERDGDEYHFITAPKAIKMLKERKFIEAAYTHGYLYGTSIEEFKIAKQEGKIAVADIDIKGVRSYRQLSTNVLSVFLLPPSFNILIDRLIARYGKSHREEDIKVRLATALDELSELLNTDYYHSIVNFDISTTTNKVLDIVNGGLLPKTNPNALKLAQQLIDDIKKYLAH